jgi:hypothetical protein
MLFSPLARSWPRPARLARWAVKASAPNALLQRHVTGDWGELSEEDRRENELSIKEGLRIFSAHKLPRTGAKLWIITEADRSVTAILLPDEY